MTGEQLLKEYLIENNLVSNDEVLKKFERYFELLVEWNNKFNLTTITEREQVYLKHFYDSIVGQNHVGKNALLLDIGSGAGFPAIPILIARQDVSAVLIDSLGKRVNFLNAVIDELGLKNCKAVHTRAEDWAKDNRERADVIVARGVAGMNILLEYSIPLLKVGGKLIAYKGVSFEEELLTAKNAMRELGCVIESKRSFTLPNSEGERSILVIKKIKKTNEKYPRGGNKPRISPL